MNIKDILKRSFSQSLKIAWILIKIYIPLSIFTIFLKQTGCLDYIAPYFSPLLKYMGLPGDAAICLLVGFTNNIYAGVATIYALDLSFRQITILGICLGICHSIFVETGILTKLRFAKIQIAFFRIFFAIFTGILMNLILPETISGKVFNPFYKSDAFSWLSAVKGIITTCLQIIVIIFIIITIYELLVRWKYSSSVKGKMKFITRLIGLSEYALTPWFVGFFIGITYGAGILLNFAEKKVLSHKDICLTTLFLCITHAIIEDTMIFAVIGGNPWWIAIPRIAVAFLFVRILAINDFYRKFLWLGLRKK